jgi:hypothetical protein
MNEERQLAAAVSAMYGISPKELKYIMDYYGEIVSMDEHLSLMTKRLSDNPLDLFEQVLDAS